MADKTLIDAVVHVEFYKKRFGFFCRKLNLKVSSHVIDPQKMYLQRNQKQIVLV